METEENQPVHKGLKKGLYLIPTAFTAANIAMGFLAVLFSIRGFQTVLTDAAQSAYYFDNAAIAIGLAILFDTLDGRVARMTKTATEIGVQLDSLADVLTFGIAPIALIYGWGIGATFDAPYSVHNLGIFALFMYLMCGTFRLARFNLQATRPRVLKEGATKVDKKNFVGLPIPPAAGLLIAIVHFSPYPLVSKGENLGQFYAVLMMFLLGGLGLLMVSTFRYTSFKSVGTSRRHIYLMLLLAALGMLVWLYSQYVLLIAAIIYVSHGIVIYLVNMMRPRKRAEMKAEKANSQN